jgi:hypothetical protein
VVFLAGEQRPRFQFRNVIFRRGQLFFQILQQFVPLRCVGLFLRQMNVRLDIAGNGIEVIVRGNLFFGALPLAQNALRGFLIVPEIRIGGACFQRFQPFAVACGVKDSSARVRCAASVLRSCIAGLRESFLFPVL